MFEINDSLLTLLKSGSLLVRVLIENDDVLHINLFPTVKIDLVIYRWSTLTMSIFKDITHR